MSHNINIQDYKAQLLGFAITIGVSGFLIPNTAIKTAIIASMTGVSIGSLAAYKASQSSANYQIGKFLNDNERQLNAENQQIKELTQKLNTANNDRAKTIKDLEHSQAEVTALKTLNNGYIVKLDNVNKSLADNALIINSMRDERDTIVNQLMADKQVLSRELEAKALELTNFEKDLTTVKANLTKLLTDYVDARVRFILNTVEVKCKLENYEKVHEQLELVKEKARIQQSKHLDLLVKLQDLTSIVDIASIVWQIVDESSSIKVKYNNVIGLDNAITAQHYLDYLPKSVTKDKAKQALEMQRQKLEANFEPTINLFRDNASEFESMKVSVQNYLDEIDERNLKIDALQQQIEALRRPIKWTLVSANRILSIGNLMIDFFYTNAQIILDRAYSESDAYEAKIYFQIDRNQRGILPKELTEHSEALQQFCRLLHPVEFAYDADKALMYARVVLKAKEKVKAPKESDINKIWVSVDKFESYVKNFERVRITAGSTGGKSPTAKNLALAIMKSRKGNGEIKLYDPQHGSKKDYWNMPKAGTSHEDNLKGMQELCSLIDTRRGENNHKFMLYIFDEVDDTVVHLKEGYKFKDLIKVSLKEGSHANTGAIYIGQSSDANEVPGMTYSNWNNAVQIHIGSNAGLVINNLKTITEEDKTRLLEQYRKVQEYCDTKNEELGLDIFTDATAYRFALVVPLSGLPKFIQLPDFDTYDYNEVMNQNKSQPEVKDAAPVLSAKCPYCGSENVVKNGKTRKGQQYYSCQDCENTPKRWIN